MREKFERQPTTIAHNRAAALTAISVDIDTDNPRECVCVLRLPLKTNTMAFQRWLTWVYL